MTAILECRADWVQKCTFQLWMKNFCQQHFLKKNFTIIDHTKQNTKCLNPPNESWLVNSNSPHARRKQGAEYSHGRLTIWNRKVAVIDHKTSLQLKLMVDVCSNPNYHCHWPLSIPLHEPSSQGSLRLWIWPIFN